MKREENTLYLVTGAAGFLGGHVCRQLLERGDRVRAFVLPKDVEIVEGDLCDRESLEPFFSVEEGTKTICIHVASMVTVDPDFNQKLIDINVGGTKNMIAKCLEHGECEKLVYVSSTGAIPESPKGEKIREADTFDPNQVVGWYSKSKAMATQAVLDAANTRHLNACVVHPSGIIGPGDYAREEVTRTLIKVLNGELSAGMAGSFNLCDVRDLAHGCVMAADRGRRGGVLVSWPIRRSPSGRCARSWSRRPLPGPKVLPAAGHRQLGGQADGAPGGEKPGKAPILSSFAVYNLARNNSFDSSKAAAELDYHTRPLPGDPARSGPVAPGGAYAPRRLNA